MAQGSLLMASEPGHPLYQGVLSPEPVQGSFCNMWVADRFYNMWVAEKRGAGKFGGQRPSGEGFGLALKKETDGRGTRSHHGVKWTVFADVLKSLSADDKRVAELVGVHPQSAQPL